MWRSPLRQAGDTIGGVVDHLHDQSSELGMADAQDRLPRARHTA
jgi:hypothetical protein